MFIVTCVRRSEDAIGVMKEALTSTNPTERTEAIQRYFFLDKFQIYRNHSTSINMCACLAYAFHL